MSLLLNIHTSTEVAFVSLTEDERIISCIENDIQKDHAVFIHPAINEMMQLHGKEMTQLDAISVTAGPGSYTGIRVGLATAKGLCFSLNKPLITLNTLEILTRDVINHYNGSESDLFCPMIDARRMEVYTAVYDRKEKVIVPPMALTVVENFYRKFSTMGELILFGSGSVKCRQLAYFQNAKFIDNVNISMAMAALSSEAYSSKAFADLAFSEPSYLKEFYDNRN